MNAGSTTSGSRWNATSGPETCKPLKDGREDGREEGREEGQIIGSVQVLQAFNGLARQSTAELSQLPSEELAAIEHELTVRYHVRREAANGGVVSPVDPPCRPAVFP